jgi:teichuronic acid biosynthesis glycosyltransferase TuaC
MSHSAGQNAKVRGETVRALIVTNMYPSPERPHLGSFVRDQVDALRRLSDIELEVFAFDPGGLGAYAGAALTLRRDLRGTRFDIVHAHFGLSAWPALAVRARAHVVTLHGTDLFHRRSRPITLAALPFQSLTAVVSAELAGRVPGWAARGEVAVLPCGIDMMRFRRLPRFEARAALGLPADAPCLLFPADPARPEKRIDRARAAAEGVRLLTLGGVEPERVPLFVNAANAVLVPSEREGFGLAVLEALACDVPVLATPCGIAPEALAGVTGTLCEPFDATRWQAALAPHLSDGDPRIVGRAHAEPYSSDRLAARVMAAWSAVLGASGTVGDAA